jgi:anti-sigma28 factor (negative regulator of flagellin synthesis)
MSSLSKLAEADPARLERLRAAIRSGTYSIPAREIASRIVADQFSEDLPRR